MARNFKDILWSFIDIFFLKKNVVEIVHKMSTLHIHICGSDCIHAFFIMDIINHSAGLITSFHMLDAVVRGMFTPCNAIFSPTRTSTQLAVYCVLQIYLSVVWWWILRVKQCPLNCIKRCWEIFNQLMCYYILILYYTSDTQNYMDVLGFKFAVDYHLNSIYIYYCYIWLVGFCYVIMYTILSVYCKVYVYLLVFVHVHLVYWRHV